MPNERGETFLRFKVGDIVRYKRDVFEKFFDPGSPFGGNFIVTQVTGKKIWYKNPVTKQEVWDQAESLELVEREVSLF